MSKLVNAWYRGAWFLYLLWPLSILFRVVACLRKLYFIPKQTKYKFDAPIIVVGNLTVGGTGKTPLVLYLAEKLKQNGLKPGIVSRGFAGSSTNYPVFVEKTSTANQVGDEALLLAKRSACPVVVDPDRTEAVKQLLKHYDCNVVISDDGLQHYKMPRDIEIVVIDGTRRFGNKLCLPAGPLREPLSRLQTVDCIVVNGKAQTGEFKMQLKGKTLLNCKTGKAKLLSDFVGKEVHAVAGIGNPERFFAALRAVGVKVTAHPMPDHHAFVSDDLNFKVNLPIIMTEKDAVKCKALSNKDTWFLPVEAELDEKFFDLVMNKLKGERV